MNVPPSVGWSIHLSFRKSLSPLVRSFIHPSIHPHFHLIDMHASNLLSIRLLTGPSVCYPIVSPSFYPFVRRSIPPSIHSFAHLSIHSSYHPSICSSVHPFVCPFVSPFLHFLIISLPLRIRACYGFRL